MSDKSFGDHMSRGVVKNPLLSTAVTGLSIEDLTHNAVLLPVSRTQELFGRQEPETPSQFTPTPSGDTFTPIHPPEQNATQQKDDFDVNEYFARLQGTRYVSAPINSHIEDANTNIEKEENLEEINLNEANEQENDIQQSITQDVVQNFSQLPTVLPQVASAVFSSFSNMLMKRETEKVQGVKEMEPMGAREMEVPLVGVSEKPPLKEPPVSAGPGNFRITTKKKYAQIPGLSSGEPAQLPTFTPPTFNQPIFTPPQQEYKENFTNIETTIPTLDAGQTNVNFDAFSNIVQNIPKDTQSNTSNVFEAPKQDGNTVATSQFQQESNQGIIPPPPMFSNLAKRDSLPSVGKTILPPSVARRIGSNKPTISNQGPAFAAVGNIFVPAPVAAEMPSDASQQPFIGQNPPSSFPPRFTSQETSQPVISPSAPVPPTMASSVSAVPIATGVSSPIDSSITVPTGNVSTFGTSTLPPPPKNAFSTPPAIVPHPTVSSITGNLPPPPKNTLNTPVVVSQATDSSVTGNLSLPPKNAFSTQPPIAPNASAPAPTNAESVSVLSTPQFYTPGSQPLPVAPPSILPKSAASIIPPPTNIQLFPNPSVTSSSTPAISSLPPSSSSYLQNQSSAELSAQNIASPPAPQIFNPTQHVSLLSRGITDDELRQMGLVAEPPKIPEPPKAAGTTNFRMTKKRPQYYSGPIEGVGAISNNIKPTLTPVVSSAFQGAVFTPETNTGYQAAVFTPENVTENVPSTLDVNLNSENNQQKQFYNFAPVDISQPPNSINYNAPEPASSNYNTTFDLSRQVPDAYEPPKAESSFGLIGSIKSKLSSIDINKLQNSVTTFFDPGYNMVKTETDEKTQPSYGQNQGIEICVANPETQTQPYNYDAHQNNFTYGHGSIPNASDYYNQQSHNVYSTTSYYSEPSYGTQSFSQTMPAQVFSQPNYPTSTVNTENTQQFNVWGTYNPTSIGCEKENDSNVVHEPTPVIDTGSSQGINIWGTSDSANITSNQDNTAENVNVAHEVTSKVGTYNTSIGCEKENDSNVLHEPKPIIDTGSSQGVNVWGTCDSANIGSNQDNTAENVNVAHEVTSKVGTYNPTSIGCEKENDSNVLHELKPIIDIGSSQGVNVWGTYDSANTGCNEDNVVENINVAHEVTSKVDTDSTHKVYEWSTYDYPGVSYDNSTVAQNNNITQEVTSSVETQSALNANIWGTYNPSSFAVGDKNNVEEHKIANIDVIDQSKLAENIAEAIKNLHIGDDTKTSSEEIGLSKEQNAPVDILPQPISYVSENVELDKSAIFNVDMLQNVGMTEVPQVRESPLKNPCSKFQEISDGVSEGGVSWNSNEETVDDQSEAERLMTLTNEESEDEQGDNLDICETCREVNQPEENDDDLTHKLIKNITAPIQLSNPVEVPLTETDVALPAKEEFDAMNQCAEISLIADETVETLQVQSAAELLNETESTNIETSYGWRTEAPLPPGEDLLDHDYTFKANTNAIGFFANNNLFFDNLPTYDEIKTDLNIPQTDTALVLQRQMSIPTAPPAEDSDDAKSDETGVLDVQSIEQDASKDFPVFEEYVIEPSEADEDKVEFKNKSDEVKDTFTYRVDRFKKLEGNDDTEQKDADNLAISNTLMPSYFDTGNYAVEAHFKNSRSSPTIARIPPGFEDHYELVPRNRNQKYEPIKIPDTTTQTTLTTTVTDAQTKTENVTSSVFSSMPPFTNKPASPEPQPRTALPDFATVFVSKIQLEDTNAEDIIETKKTTPVNPQANFEDKVQESSLKTLPDPINFFASSTQEPDTAEGGNRLASYFAAAPAKTDNTKSFFELSQGQNHYRQDETKGGKPFFELSQSQDHYKENISNIPHDRYIANLNLIKDLTSCQNRDPSKEQIVKTVNYFTVEYDTEILNFNKGEPSLKINQPFFKNKDNEVNDNFDKNINTTIKEETSLNDVTLAEIVHKCKHCCDSKAGPVLTIRETDLSVERVRFRQAMTSDSPRKEAVNMQPGNESERSVNVKMEDLASDGDNSEGVAMMTENRSTNEYEPVKHHWFYRVDTEDKSTWRGFSVIDSNSIESAFQSPSLNENTLVPTDGGRYDVNVIGRLRTAVYWSDKPTNVRRCSWFYKGTTDARYVPYTEAVAEKLEVEYRHGITTGEWHRRLLLPNNELVVMHGPAVMVHFLQASGADTFSAPNLLTFGKRVYRNPPKFKVSGDQPPQIDHLLLLVHGAGEWRCQKDKIQSTMRPRVVRRGIDESEIEDTEPSSIDHLLLLCHGVGSACDMRFRAVEEVVDDFRATSLQLLQSHYRNSSDNGIVGRVEVLPISWHASLHSGPKGVDRRLARVTLASIPRLRSFTNDTVLDVLFYTSPHYCQMILDTVCNELNRIYTLFVSRNPDFKGRVSLGGHSLGSVILYDLLCNQPIPRNPVKARPEKTYISGSLANNPILQYPTLCFEPLALYALGSPIAIFECIRGVEMLGSEFFLPTCRNFFNIFHPYDPIAYRIEPLVNAQLQDVKPSLIPHHKGRKRMHLELKDTMARVGADLKQKLVESIKNTWSSMWATAAPPDHQLEKVVEEEIEKEQLEEENSKEETVQADVTPGEMLGRLNNGRRVDYVLQEAPFEMINEYLFAMSSHVCYWESEDVMLLILREIYDSMGVQPDVTVPQQSLTVQRTIVAGETIVTTDASTSRMS